jgi:hypothetical protein
MTSREGQRIPASGAKVLAQARLALRVAPGKGSHGLLLVNGRRTTVPNLKAELKRGLYFGLLRNLGITEKDLLDG